MTTNKGGKEARDGFWFQDATVLLRLLEDSIDRRAKIALGLAAPEPLVVRIEAAAITKKKSNPSGPLWDSTYRRGSTLIVDESKKGGPSAPERIDFYRRIRSTVATGTPVAHIHPRITVARGKLDNELKWHDLAKTVKTAKAKKTAKPIRTAKALAEEALFYLTAPDAFSDKKKKKKKTTTGRSLAAMSLPDARAVLGRFTLDATHTLDELDNALTHSLIAIGAQWSSADLIDALRGWIDRVARNRRVDMAVTADLLVDEVQLVGRYLGESREVEDVWHRFRTARVAQPPSLIPTQTWRDVQPVMNLGPRQSTGHRTVLTARGGIGKTFLLTQLYFEESGQRAWIDARTSTGIEAALAFGAWACQRRGESLKVFVDGLDQLASPETLLTTIERALIGYSVDVFVAARETTWAPISASLPGWRELALAPWDAARVRDIANSKRAISVSADLIELLRTPLLLDLFLRTFDLNETVPDGLASRHGLLKAYFMRRVLPSSGKAAAARRRSLDRGVESIFFNSSSWTDEAPAAEELVSEGVFIQSLGEYSFRHALLRDFAASTFLSRSDAAEIASRLGAITNPTTRNDLLRAVVEARLDPAAPTGPRIEDIIRECPAQGVAPAIALGSTDAPTGDLVTAIATIDNGNVLRQAIIRAQVVGNGAWIRTVGSIGGQRPHWLGDIQLDAMSRLSEFALESYPSSLVTKDLARTFRRWTFGETGDSWAIASVLKLVTQLLHDDDTLVWLGSLSFERILISSEVLSQVKAMLTNGHATNANAARNALFNLILGSARGRNLQSHERWQIARALLSSDGKKQGVLASRPDVALPLIFELSAVDAERERRRRDERDRGPEMQEALARFAQAIFPEREDLASAQSELQRLPTLSEDEAWNGLVDDVPPADGGHDDVDQLFQAVTTLNDVTTIFDTAATSAVNSRSIRARLWVLRESKVERDANICGTVLSDPRLYHSVYALPDLNAAISRYWPHMGSSARGAIQRNIFEMARSPNLRVMAVGRVARAVPPTDRDTRLQPYVDFTDQHSGRMRAQNAVTQIEDEADEPEGADNGVRPSSEARLAFTRFRDASQNPASEEAATELVNLLHGNHLGQETPDETWLLVSSVMNHDERAHQPRLISGEHARKLFDIALAVAAGGPAREEASIWRNLIDIADAGAGHVEHQNSREMRDQLLAEVEAAAGSDARNNEHATQALTFVRSWNWFHESPGTALFVKWIDGRLEAEGVIAALHYFRFFGVADRISMFRTLLESSTRLAGSPETLSIFNSAGRQLASLAFWSADQQARALINSWCAAAVKPGLLNDRRYWRQLLDGFAWSLQDALRNAERAKPTTVDRALTDQAIDRYAQLASLIWSAWPEHEDEDRNAIGWAILGPFERDYDGPKRNWSQLLRSVVLSILTRGGYADLSAALLGFQWDRCDLETLVAAAAAMRTRAAQEGTDRYALAELVRALGKVGPMRQLPLSEAYNVLACLESLGTRYPQATVVASLVETRIRLEQAP